MAAVGLLFADASSWFDSIAGGTYVCPTFAIFLIVAVGWLFARAALRSEHDIPTVQSRFLANRPELEASFFRAASASGKPRGLRWKACEWDSGVAFAREKATNQLAALVGVTIQFEAIEGGDMEGVAAVGNLRNASAVFFYYRGRWQTLGKTVFNMNPDEALKHFAAQYEPVK